MLPRPDLGYLANPRLGFGTTKSEGRGSKLEWLSKLFSPSSPTVPLGAAVTLIGLDFGGNPGGGMVPANFADVLQLAVGWAAMLSPSLEDVPG